MKMLLVLGSIVVPVLMYVLQMKWTRLRGFFNGFAILATLVFGNIASLSIYQVIKDNSVFMTKIHAVFLNPYFLIAGSYIGVYILYLLLILLEENKQG